MTYKTRQEVLRAAADWMDVCEKAGVIGEYRVCGITNPNSFFDGTARPESYEFPLALLEGKEVWVGSDVYDGYGNKLTVQGKKQFNDTPNVIHLDCGNYGYVRADRISWNPPKPKTVMVEIAVKDAEFFAKQHSLGSYDNWFKACKKALEKL